jgi:hypothetical protein
MEQNHFSIKLLLYCIPVLFFAGCKVPYDPPVNSSKTHYLVVDGYLNGNGTTTIKLSRTRSISKGDTAADIMEKGALLVIEDESNNIWPPLNEIGNGIYAGNYALFPGNRYRLHITTANGKEYLSDFVSFKQAPPIDNITWDFKNGGVQLYANTHDPKNSTRFYRWSFEETWEFHSTYNSQLIWNDQLLKVVPRTEQVDTCWQKRNSTGIFLGSSAKLNEDVINEAPINLISQGDQRISVLYSILVTQYALDSTGYNYWNAMKRNTENIGSIFDPQPNQLRGNIHCTTDTSENVVGYVGAGSTQQKRTFISNSQMPSDWNSPSFCFITNVPDDSIVYYLGGGLGLIPIDTIMSPPDSRFGYTSSFINCVDCTYYGTNVKPGFWP